MYHDQSRAAPPEVRTGRACDGSKKLKAVVARAQRSGDADKVAAQKYIVAHIKTLTLVGSLGISPMEKHHKYGTSFTKIIRLRTAAMLRSKLGGIGVIDFPNRAGPAPDVFAGMGKRSRLLALPDTLAKRS